MDYRGFGVTYADLSSKECTCDKLARCCKKKYVTLCDCKKLCTSCTQCGKYFCATCTKSNKRAGLVPIPREHKDDYYWYEEENYTTGKCEHDCKWIDMSLCHCENLCECSIYWRSECDICKNFIPKCNTVLKYFVHKKSRCLVIKNDCKPE